jgi:hypothetical protein
MTCIARIATFIAAEDEKRTSDNGGYNVHPADSPSSRAIARTIITVENRSIWYDQRLRRGDEKS